MCLAVSVVGANGYVRECFGNRHPATQFCRLHLHVQQRMFRRRFRPIHIERWQAVRQRFRHIHRRHPHAVAHRLRQAHRLHQRTSRQPYSVRQLNLRTLHLGSAQLHLHQVGTQHQSGFDCRLSRAVNGIYQRQCGIDRSLFLLQPHQQPIALLHLLEQVAVAHLRLLFGRLNAQLCQAVARHNLAAHIDRLHRRHAHHVAVLAHRHGIRQPESRSVVAVERGQQVAHRGVADVVDVKFQHRVQRIVGAGLRLHLRKVFREYLRLHLLGLLDGQLRFADIAIVLRRQRQTRIECEICLHAVCRLCPCGGGQAAAQHDTQYIYIGLFHFCFMISAANLAWRASLRA